MSVHPKSVTRKKKTAIRAIAKHFALQANAKISE